MSAQLSLIKSANLKTIALVEDIGKKLNIDVISRSKIVNFLLDLQENGFRVAIVEFEYAEQDCLKWVQLIRRLRPKMPLIVLCEQIEQTIEGQMHQENIFYLGLQPVDKETLFTVFASALKTSR